LVSRFPAVGTAVQDFQRGGDDFFFEFEHLLDDEENEEEYYEKKGVWKQEAFQQLKMKLKEAVGQDVVGGNNGAHSLSGAVKLVHLMKTENF